MTRPPVLGDRLHGRHRSTARSIAPTPPLHIRIRIRIWGRRQCGFPPTPRVRIQGRAAPTIVIECPTEPCAQPVTGTGTVAVGAGVIVVVVRAVIAILVRGAQSS